MTKEPKIIPVDDQIYLEIEEANLGGLKTDSMKVGMEWATIKAIGKEVKNKELVVGAKVFVKGWAVDTILYDKKNYHFTTEERKGICAIIK